MQNYLRDTNRSNPGWRCARHIWTRPFFLLLGFLSGCASLTNPVADGIPVRRLPSEILASPKEEEQDVPLNLLRQKPPKVYQLDAGDILGVYVGGILGENNQPPPIREQANLPPSMGYPVLVREDGSVSLPMIKPVKVKGMTTGEAQDAIRKAYTVDQEILKAGRERIIVTLMKPRQYHVLVVRQDGGQGGTSGLNTPVNIGGGGGSGQASIVIGPQKRGSGFAIDLNAYENDVMNALTRTGGLPGLDAKNEVVILRGSTTGGMDEAAFMRRLMQCPPHNRSGFLSGLDENMVRIPLRLKPGEDIPFKPEDVILKTGDIVFIESRDTEVFYTGGLLFSGQYPLPRDYDLDVVQAIAVVRGALVSGGQSSNFFTSQFTQVGIGFPNPSLVTVLRQTPNYGQVAVRVDLNRALSDPRERLLIQPKDIIILQQTVGEALANYVTTTMFKYNIFATIIRQRDLTGTSTLSGP